MPLFSFSGGSFDLALSVCVSYLIWVQLLIMCSFGFE